ncbi:hypothetical protein N9Q05_00780 [bacterium]|nr:hypothetical protein [bacterium]MDB4298044.1 hypothetical protein [bacterium]
MSKLTDEQLKSVKEGQGKINSILVEIGFLEAKKAEFLGAHFEAVKALEEVKSELKEEYGDITVNLADGSFEKIEAEVEEAEVLEIVK